MNVLHRHRYVNRAGSFKAALNRRSSPTIINDTVSASVMVDPSLVPSLKTKLHH